MTANSVLFGNLSALVVDDDRPTRAMVARMLVNMGFRAVLQAPDGHEALDLIKREQPSVLICDIEMEPLDGLAVLRTLRHTGSPKEKAMPVVFLTNHAETEVVTQAKQLGVDSFVLKPVSPERLRDRILRVMSR